MNVLGYTESGTIRIVIDGTEMIVPDDMANRHRQMIAEWEAEGNTIPAYDIPETDLYTYAAQKRWEIETGGITLNGMSVFTDDRSKSLILGARLAAESDSEFTTEWKGVDGTFVTIDAPTIIAVSNAILEHVRKCFATEAGIIADIESGAITTIEEINNAFDNQ